MSAKYISIIYFYLISAASLALIVIGIFSAVNFIVNTTQYEKYPLESWQVNSCRPIPSSYPSLPPTSGPIQQGQPEPVLTATISAQELERQKECEEQVVQDRRKQKINDAKNALTFSLIGLILFSIHFPLALKRSKT